MMSLYATGPFGILVASGERRSLRKSSELTNEDGGELNEFFVNLIIWELEERLNNIANRRQETSKVEDNNTAAFHWLKESEHVEMKCTLHPSIRQLVEGKSRELHSHHAEVAMEEWRGLDLTDVTLEDIPGQLFAVLQKQVQKQERKDESKPPLKALVQWLHRAGRSRRVSPETELEAAENGRDVSTPTKDPTFIPRRNFKSVFRKIKDVGSYSKFGEGRTEMTDSPKNVPFYNLCKESENKMTNTEHAVNEDCDSTGPSRNADDCIVQIHTANAISEPGPCENSTTQKIKDNLSNIFKLTLQQGVDESHPHWMKLRELPT